LGVVEAVASRFLSRIGDDDLADPTTGYRVERTLSIHSFDTPRREAFYWLAILFTFALGTAAGDLIAERYDVGYWKAALLFGASRSVRVGTSHLERPLNAVGRGSGAGCLWSKSHCSLPGRASPCTTFSSKRPSPW
jgi:uncharacterized membrane-anchored protein